MPGPPGYLGPPVSRPPTISGHVFSSRDPDVVVTSGTIELLCLNTQGVVATTGIDPFEDRGVYQFVDVAPGRYAFIVDGVRFPQAVRMEDDDVTIELNLHPPARVYAVYEPSAHLNRAVRMIRRH